MDWLIILFCGLFISCALLFQCACIVYAPFAAWTTLRHSGETKLSRAWRPVIAGAVSVVFLLGLWVYLEAKMKDEPFSVNAIRRGYLWLYTFWASVIFSNTAIVVVFFRAFRVGGLWDNLSLIAPAIVPLLTGLPLWIISGLLLLYTQQNVSKGTTGGTSITLPSLVFVLPFASTSANVIVLPMIFLLLDPLTSLFFLTSD